MPSEPRPSSRRERRRLETRSRIIEAAQSLFQASGYQATTVAEICDHADVAYKTFFNHFPSKHEVLHEVEARSLDSLLAHLRQVLDVEATTRERITTFFERIAKEAEAAGPMNRELLAEMIHSAHTRGDEPDQIRRVVAAIERIVQAGIDQGDVRTDYAVETLAEMIRGNYYALMISFGNLADYPIVARARALAALLADTLEETHTTIRKSQRRRKNHV
jgi:AcrR family transcriptional regulator